MARNTQSSRARSQRGGTFLGLVLGLIVGLAIAVVVAVYITKAPVPFVSRGGAQPKPSEAGNVVNTLPTPVQPAPQASAPQAADPNAPLWSRVPAKPVDQAADQNNPPPGITIHPAQPSSAPQVASAPGAKPPKPPVTASNEKPVTDPIAEIARQDAAKTGYFLQVGAYKSSEDAERQKGNLAMQGFEAKVTQREVNGATMYRVRLGPFNSLDEMTAVRSRLQSTGVESSVIRFARQ
ncbi:SPOR domain-containing protein [Ralstonia sp. NFACC01]|mgnify:FL=1|jgi:cell division protein FtsN|uniref:SPOR domain-containing protein n=1 Tax=unclassified Ralstonia TaxID=209769 RepID=UPI0008E4BC1F|nr:SPOR domain-containing protein [Ralstonia sp. NFACC01]SFP90283.1 Cell division protein FtsN [Ralstonia sp. NFACC01]